jgi:hypothetical protein
MREENFSVFHIRSHKQISVYVNAALKDALVEILGEEITDASISCISKTLIAI